MPRVFVVIFLVVRFALELIMLGVIGFWAAKLPLSTFVRVALGVLAVVAAAFVWGMFVSPKARVRLPESARLGVELCVVAAAVVALRFQGRVLPALLLGAAAVASALINSLLRRNRGHVAA